MDTQQPPPVYLFVYGTLRRGTGHPLSDRLQENSEYLGSGQTPGRLYDLGAYPGAVWVDDARDVVWGEVYRLQGDGSELLRELDEYEGPEYRRESVVVETTSGRLSCWAYRYLIRPRSGQLIPSGDYFQHLKTRKRS